MITQFQMDGVEYNVQVISLKRSFEVKDAIAQKIAQSGDIYRNPVGTYYHYTIGVREKDGDREALDRFWDAISRPEASHVCVFPYNQSTITQKMYVTTGNQSIIRLYANGAAWHDITVNYKAAEPKVLP